MFTMYYSIHSVLFSYTFWFLLCRAVGSDVFLFVLLQTDLHQWSVYLSNSRT